MRLTLVDSQIAAVAENNRVRVLALAVVAYSALRVLHRHMRSRLRYALDLAFSCC